MGEGIHGAKTVIRHGIGRDIRPIPSSKKHQDYVNGVKKLTHQNSVNHLGFVHVDVKTNLKTRN